MRTASVPSLAQQPSSRSCQHRWRCTTHDGADCHHPQQQFLRFGHPGVWPYLVHGLGRDECAEDAARALETLFGALVDAEEDDAASAWRAALPETPIPPDAHLRRGEAWSAKVVLAECASGALRRREVELRYDELRARGGRVPAGDLAAWGSAPA